MQDGDDEKMRRKRRSRRWRGRERERDNKRREVVAALLDVAECAVVIYL
jgi:hypothetical protein